MTKLFVQIEVPEGEYCQTKTGVDCGRIRYSEGGYYSFCKIDDQMLKDKGQYGSYKTNECLTAPVGLIQKNARLRDALKEIAKREGPYKMDQLEHAGAVIENMGSIADEALKATE